MKILKNIVRAIWPIVLNQLEKLADRTATPWDDMAVDTVNFVIRTWLDMTDDDDDPLE